MQIKEWKIKLLASVVILAACFIVDIKIRGFSNETVGEGGVIYVSCIGKIVGIDAGQAIGEPPTWTWSVDGQILTLEVMSGRFKGQRLFSSNVLIGEYSDRIFKQGDRVYITIPSSKEGIINTMPISVGEYVRVSFLLHLVTGFLILLIVIGGSKGIRAAVALIASGVFIASVLIPMFLRGYNPIWAATLVSAINTVVTFLLVGGVTRKSLAGVLGSLGGLATAALLASFYSRILHFSGLDVSFGFFNLGIRLGMAKESADWNFSALLVSGMILGASGAIMDASMAVASAIDEVKRANPQLGAWRCILSGMNVGKDEMGTMANTLIFAYIGADLTLILMPMIQFGEAGQVFPLTRIINQESSSAEIVQAIAGTIGLIMAIPITALVAGILIGRTHKAEIAVEMPVEHKLKRQWLIPVALLAIAVGGHAAYIVTRHASAVQRGGEEEQSAVSEYVRAKVIEKNTPLEVPSPSSYAREPAKSEILRVKLQGGDYKNQEVLIQNIVDPNRIPLYNVVVNPGDEVLVKVDGTQEGIYRASMHNYSRDGYLLYLAVLFVFLMVMVGRFQGIRTALALGISIAVVFKVLMPLIMKGYNPGLVVIGVAGIIAFVSLAIVTGINRKAGAATIGIMGGVIVACLIVLYADQKLHFTGISSSRVAIVAQFTISHLDFRKILMAGIIMGLLGSAMDAAIIVASAVREVRRANPKMTSPQLISAGMNVGTDVLGTMANTLPFAYVGLRLTLLMTFAGTSIFSGSKLEIMSVEPLAAEALRILAGSIGLVLTIPITAVAAAYWDKIAGFLGFGGGSA